MSKDKDDEGNARQVFHPVLYYGVFEIRNVAGGGDVEQMRSKAAEVRGALDALEQPDNRKRAAEAGVTDEKIKETRAALDELESSIKKLGA